MSIRISGNTSRKCVLVLVLALVLAGTAFAQQGGKNTVLASVGVFHFTASYERDISELFNYALTFSAVVMGLGYVLPFFSRLLFYSSR